MPSRTEYTEVLVLTRDQLEDIRLGQFDIRYHGYQVQNENNLSNALVGVATILSLAFKLPTPVTLAAGVIATVIGSTQSLLDTFINMARRGEDYLQESVLFLRDNPQYSAIEVELPFLEFLDEDEGYRIVSGYGAIQRVKADNGWVYP